MDTGKGEFRGLTIIEEGNEVFMKQNATHLFRVGEEITVKGSLMKVLKITPKKIVLRLLPRR
jgi:hypothetical protein